MLITILFAAFLTPFQAAREAAGRTELGLVDISEHQTQPVYPLQKPEETYGFWFPVFNQIPSALRVVRQARRFYPDSPIHLLQDGGKVDFSEVCLLPQYNCTFEVVRAENSRWNPHSWFRRMRHAAQLLKTTYIIYLEPDVEIRHRHVLEPPFDAGGLYDNWNFVIPSNVVDYLETQGRKRNPNFKVLWKHFGLSGGSYYRTEAILDAFSPEHIRRIDWSGLFDAEREVTYSSDMSMLLALNARGWTVYPWQEVGQYSISGEPTDPTDVKNLRAFAAKMPAFHPDAAFQHNHKEHYHDEVPEPERSLLKELPQGEKVDCIGCVWYKGINLDERLPIPSPPPTVENAEDRCRQSIEAQVAQVVLGDTTDTANNIGKTLLVGSAIAFLIGGAACVMVSKKGEPVAHASIASTEAS